jgi:GTP-binding protein
MGFFIDEARIQAMAGNGGNGCVSFRREKYVPKGGPDGGNGGSGGDIVLIARQNVQTLANLKGQYRYKAGRGQHGQGKNKTGYGGEDLIIEVPVGTIIKDEDTGIILGDMVSPDQRLIIAHGGKGGRGNASFKTSTNQVPREASPGQEGQVRNLILELKVLADVGLVGFPNAGKSTLLTSLSNANPEIGAYPFTTLTPQLGVVPINEWEHFVMADIPGIISGAHEGKGLGLRFLRHIERTKVLLFLLDIFDEDLAKTFEILRNELASYKTGLENKRFLVALNKVDSYTPEQVEETRIEFLRKTGVPEEKVFCISGLKKEGLDKVKSTLADILEQEGKAEEEPENLPG